MFKASHLEIEVRAEGDDAPEGTISGYGSKFDLVDSYNETIRKGAFKGSLAEWRRRKNPIPMLWQHNASEPIGAWTEFREDDVGLFLKGHLLLDMPEARKAWTAIQARVVTGLSIGYYELDADPWYDPEREGPRVVRKLDLRETSVVTFPALREAQLDQVRAAIARGERPTLREFERFLQRELHVSRSEAQAIAESGYKDWITRERGPEAIHDDMPAARADLDAVRAILSGPSPFDSL